VVAPKLLYRLSAEAVHPVGLEAALHQNAAPLSGQRAILPKKPYDLPHKPNSTVPSYAGSSNGPHVVPVGQYGDDSTQNCPHMCTATLIVHR
jgi:hypothetical protein